MSVSSPAAPRPLTQCRKGELLCVDAVVGSRVFGALDELVSRRLADLGFCAGTPLTLVATGLWGRGPFAVCLGNQSQFALRATEAAKIMCRPLSASL